MNEAVPPFFGTPVLTRTGNTGFTSIDVDAQVTTPDRSKFDAIFVGTSMGQLRLSQKFNSWVSNFVSHVLRMYGKSKNIKRIAER